MREDVIVADAEIRQVRHGISERLGHDPQQVIAYYIELQRQYAERCLPAEGEELPEENLRQRVKRARRSLRSGRGVKIEDVKA